VDGFKLEPTAKKVTLELLLLLLLLLLKSHSDNFPMSQPAQNAIFSVQFSGGCTSRSVGALPTYYSWASASLKVIQQEIATAVFYVGSVDVSIIIVINYR
jgi:hypothetical protein